MAGQKNVASPAAIPSTPMNTSQPVGARPPRPRIAAAIANAPSTSA